MTDRELLELAAKAAGIELDWVRNSGCFYYDNEETGREMFDPLEDDGDALRLAVKLLIDIDQDSNDKVETIWFDKIFDMHTVCEQITQAQDRLAATRRAIVRAAASIGKERK